MWNGLSSRYNQVLFERVEPEVRRMDAFWQATGSPMSRCSARSEARTNDLDFGVAAATPQSHRIWAGDE